MKVRDVMTPTVVTVAPDMPVREVATLLLERRISGVPVVDDKGRVLGIVSEGDLIRRPEIQTDHPHKSWLRIFASDQDGARNFIKTHGMTARDVMNAPALTVTPDASLADVTRLMDSKRVKRLPVVEKGAIVGLVTRTDLLRALVAQQAIPAVPQNDQGVRQRIVDILRTEHWAASAIVNVQVNDGTVHLWGAVDSNEQREALLVAVREVPGVREVEAHLSRTLAG